MGPGKYLLLVSVVLFSVCMSELQTRAGTPRLEWTRDLAGQFASSVAVDSRGNPYVTVYNEGKSILSKLDRNGGTLWSKELSGPAFNTAHDGAGNVLVVGENPILSKFEFEGTLLWTLQRIKEILRLKFQHQLGWDWTSNSHSEFTISDLRFSIWAGGRLTAKDGRSVS